MKIGLRGFGVGEEIPATDTNLGSLHPDLMGYLGLSGRLASIPWLGRCDLRVPDGAWTFPNGCARFHRAPAPSQGEVEGLLDVLIRRITRTLVRAGVRVEEEGGPNSTHPVLR